MIAPFSSYTQEHAHSSQFFHNGPPFIQNQAHNNLRFQSELMENFQNWVHPPTNFIDQGYNGGQPTNLWPTHTPDSLVDLSIPLENLTLYYQDP